MTKPSKTGQEVQAHNDAARIARRAVARLLAARLVPASKFGRKRAIRGEALQALSCAIKNSQACAPTLEA